MGKKINNSNYRSDQNAPPERDAKGKSVSPSGGHFDFSDNWYATGDQVPNEPEKGDCSSC